MVGQLDIKGAGKSFERQGELDVLLAWLGVARWMIVDQQQRGRSVVQGPLYEEPVTAFNPVLAPDDHNFIANVVASSIEENHEEDFVFENPNPCGEQR